MENLTPEEPSTTEPVITESEKTYKFIIPILNDDIMSKTYTDDENPVPIVHDGVTAYIISVDGKVYTYTKQYEENHDDVTSTPISPDGTIGFGFSKEGLACYIFNNQLVAQSYNYSKINYINNDNLTFGTDNYKYQFINGIPSIIDNQYIFNIFKGYKVIDSDINFSNLISTIYFYFDSKGTSVIPEIQFISTEFELTGDINCFTVSGYDEDSKYSYVIKINTVESTSTAEITTEDGQVFTFNNSEFKFETESAVTENQDDN